MSLATIPEFAQPTTQIDTTGGQGGGGSRAGLGGMQITTLDQGVANLKKISDLIKKKEADSKQLNNFEQELRNELIEKNGLGDKARKPLADYVYDDLCDGVVQELTNTAGLSKARDYKEFSIISDEDQAK